MPTGIATRKAAMESGRTIRPGARPEGRTTSHVHTILQEQNQWQQMQ